MFILKDRVENFISGLKSLAFDKDCGRAINQGWSNSFAIRPETMEKIKKLLYDDLMATCEATELGMKQEYMISGKWFK